DLLDREGEAHTAISRLRQIVDYADQRNVTKLPFAWQGIGEPYIRSPSGVEKASSAYGDCAQSKRTRRGHAPPRPWRAARQHDAGQRSGDSHEDERTPCRWWQLGLALQRNDAKGKAKQQQAHRDPSPTIGRMNGIA